MGTDKLFVTARAAGFAMACDDGSSATAPTSVPRSPLALPAPFAQAATKASDALVPIKQAKDRLNFGSLGWSFWKTA